MWNYVGKYNYSIYIYIEYFIINNVTLTYNLIKIGELLFSTDSNNIISIILTLEFYNRRVSINKSNVLLYVYR